ncbi:MAG: hypothetical protein LBR79_05210 [Oscillospiraceae bacterium]|nr:hypothetical protein [Oscillospiraceae bacterium]
MEEKILSTNLDHHPKFVKFTGKSNTPPPQVSGCKRKNFNGPETRPRNQTLN